MPRTIDIQAAATEAGSVVLDSLLGQLEPRPFLVIAAGIAEALAALHAAGLVHHDLEPSHIFVSLATGRAWIVRPHADQPSADRHRPSSLAYMAPERSGRSSSDVDGRADLYSLGVCLYELATGKLPFAANEPLEWVHAHMAVRPIPPAQRRLMPVVLQLILLKLLEKEPDDRYQLASGLAHDLRECLAQPTTPGAEPSFALGRRDVTGQLSRRLELVGRSHELDLLGAALESAQRRGAPELALVSGYSGIGKSSLVRQFFAERMPPGALVVSGKFEDRERDAPYARLMQPFRELLRWVLARPAPELDEWKAALDQALGSNGGIVVELLPELERIVEVRAPEERLPAVEARNRVFASFRRMLQAFVGRKLPLVVLLDDLQWVDGASLGLIEHLLSSPDLGGLLLIGAYREEGVTAAHPLSAVVERLRAANVSVRDVPLRPLPSLEVGRMVANLLLDVRGVTQDLAHVVEGKTGGNPFFVRQFLIALTEEGFLRFDADECAWNWDLPSIMAKGPTENLADLLLERLARLPESTQSMLESLGCLSACAHAVVLAEISGITVDELNERMRVAVRAEVVAETDQGYVFSHDRLQTAAYSRIPEAERAARHLAIGRALRTRNEGGGEALFEVVRQLNRASELLVNSAERVQLAELNLKLAQSFRSTAATATALALLEQAFRLVPIEHWQRLPDLSFELSLARAECEFLSGEHERAELLLAELAEQERDIDRLGAIVCIQLDLYSASYRWAEAIDVGVGYLRSAGTPWQTFDEDELAAEYQRLKRALGGRSVASLAGAPALSSQSVRTTMEVCVRLLGPVVQTNQRLFALVLLHVVSLSNRAR